MEMPTPNNDDTQVPMDIDDEREECEGMSFASLSEEELELLFKDMDDIEQTQSILASTTLEYIKQKTDWTEEEVDALIEFLHSQEEEEEEGK